MDPGGNMTYNELSLTMRKYISPDKLDYIIASHADPDIIASLDRWMTSSKRQVGDLFVMGTFCTGFLQNW